MNERKRGKNRKKKLIIFFSVCLVLIITAFFLSVYFRHGEWEEVRGGEGVYGADTYYIGGYGEYEVPSTGLIIRFTANVKNDGTMIADIREANENDDTNLAISFFTLKQIDTIEIKGNDTKEIFISSDEYSKIVIGTYTNDYAEADEHTEILTYITNWQKFVNFLQILWNNIEI